MTKQIATNEENLLLYDFIAGTAMGLKRQKSQQDCPLPFTASDTDLYLHVSLYDTFQNSALQRVLMWNFYAAADFDFRVLLLPLKCGQKSRNPKLNGFRNALRIFLGKYPVERKTQPVCFPLGRLASQLQIHKVFWFPFRNFYLIHRSHKFQAFVSRQ